METQGLCLRKKEMNGLYPLDEEKKGCRDKNPLRKIRKEGLNPYDILKMDFGGGRSMRLGIRAKSPDSLSHYNFLKTILQTWFITRVVQVFDVIGRLLH